MHKVKELSNAFGVTPTSVRNWSQAFADYLGPAANPEPGRTRQFSDDDFRILAGIAELKGQGIPHDEIKARLDVATPEDFEAIEIPGPQAQRPGTLEIPLLAFLERRTEAIEEDNQRLRERNAELERRIAKLEAQVLYHQKSLWSRLRGR